MVDFTGPSARSAGRAVRLFLPVELKERYFILMGFTTVRLTHKSGNPR
jgi:hypothetical protein